MPHMERSTVSITTATTGAGTGFTSVLNGFVSLIHYKGGLASTADLTITGDTTGHSLLVDSNTATTGETFYPYQLLNRATTGAGTAGTQTLLPVYNERIKIVVAQGGDTNTATFVVFVDGGNT